jgi:hypothetical protein
VDSWSNRFLCRLYPRGCIVFSQVITPAALRALRLRLLRTLVTIRDRAHIHTAEREAVSAPFSMHVFGVTVNEMRTILPAVREREMGCVGSYAHGTWHCECGADSPRECERK